VEGVHGKETTKKHRSKWVSPWEKRVKPNLRKKIGKHPNTCKKTYPLKL